MMNPIAWIDRGLLSLAAWIVKRVNWWIGMDNFWLARQMSIAQVLLSVPTFLTWAFDARWFAVILFACGLVSYGEVKNHEKYMELTCVRGVKSIEYETMLWVSRILSLMAYATLFSLCLADIYPHRKINGWFTLGIGCACAQYYFLSIDRPPLKRSQAWQWLKGKLAGWSFRPQPTPQPVPVQR